MTLVEYPVVYGMSTSGNCHKVRMTLDYLQQPYRWEEVDILKGTTREPEFLAMNPNGKVPVVKIAEDRFLSESNAVLCFFAEQTDLFPTDSWARARILQWLFFEQYSHEPFVAVARFICRFLPPDHERRGELPALHEKGYRALGVMEQQLTQSVFLVDDTYTLADIALFAYTDSAETGGFDMAGFPAIRRWLRRVRETRGFSAMPE